MTDPLDGLERPSLAECIEPYRHYGDAEFAVTLYWFERLYSHPGISTPADVGRDIYCDECEENVRSVLLPGDGTVHCPLCGWVPGLLELGRGTK